MSYLCYANGKQEPTIRFDNAKPFDAFSCRFLFTSTFWPFKNFFKGLFYWNQFGNLKEIAKSQTNQK